MIWLTDFKKKILHLSKITIELWKQQLNCPRTMIFWVLTGDLGSDFMIIQLVKPEQMKITLIIQDALYKICWQMWSQCSVNIITQSETIDPRIPVMGDLQTGKLDAVTSSFCHTDPQALSGLVQQGVFWGQFLSYPTDLCYISQCFNDLLHWSTSPPSYCIPIAVIAFHDHLSFSIQLVKVVMRYLKSSTSDKILKTIKKKKNFKLFFHTSNSEGWI